MADRVHFEHLPACGDLHGLADDGRLDLADAGRRLADQYVDGANCKALQIGSTPKRPRWASM